MGLTNFTRSASAVIPCEASLIYEILTDYDAYSDWLPTVAQSKLLAREGDLAIAEFDLASPKGDKYTFECIHTRNKMVLTRRISGKAPVTQVEWKLQAEGNQSTRVTIELQGHGFMPAMPSYRRFADGSGWLKSLQAEAASASPGISVESEGGELIVEIAETEEGLFCWLKGKKYILQPAPEGKQ
jgi:ribosome-associated toxin RatA of RatAB toxin-antitoxin module